MDADSRHARSSALQQVSANTNALTHVCWRTEVNLCRSSSAMTPTWDKIIAPKSLFILDSGWCCGLWSQEENGGILYPTSLGTPTDPQGGAGGRRRREGRLGYSVLESGWMFVCVDVSSYTVSLFTDSAGGLTLSFQSGWLFPSILRELMDSCREGEIKKSRKELGQEEEKKDRGGGGGGQGEVFKLLRGVRWGR